MARRTLRPSIRGLELSPYLESSTRVLAHHERDS
jgi:hypothetical protein